MTDEEKKAAEEAAAEEARQKAEAEQKDPLEPDYEEITRKAEEAEKAAADLAFKLREEKRKNKVVPTVPATDPEDKPLTKRELEDILANERKENLKISQESRALEVARKLTTSEAAAKAAVAYWKTRIVPTGDIEEDISGAIGMMEHKKVVAQNAELARALQARDGVTNVVLETHMDSPPGSEPQLAPDIKASLNRAGYTYDAKARVYKKKLPSGKFLIKDPRNLKQSVLA